MNEPITTKHNGVDIVYEQFTDKWHVIGTDLNADTLSALKKNWTPK